MRNYHEASPRGGRCPVHAEDDLWRGHRGRLAGCWRGHEWGRGRLTLSAASARLGHNGSGDACNGGLEALRQIRAFDPEAKVVVVTALDQKQSLMDSIRDGAIDFIVKPFERERVLALLAKLESTAASLKPI